MPWAAVRWLSLVVAATALAGCSTTMQEAARVQLNDARIRVSQVRTRVTSEGTAVRVQHLSLLRTPHDAAFVVELRNLGSGAISDLPISVGVRTGTGKTIYLNERPSPQEYSYFDAHLPVIAGGGQLTWVYTTNAKLPPRVRPFATVGAAASVDVPAQTPLPAVSAALEPATGSVARAATPAAPGAAATPARRDGVAVAVQNRSGIPQYQLQVYAFARVGGRYVAAGDATLIYLGSQDSRSLRVGLIGRLGRARVQLEALPTIFK